MHSFVDSWSQQQMGAALAAAASALASLWLSRQALRWRARTWASAWRAQLLGERARSDRREGEPARIAGALRVEGEACPRAGDRAPCAASTAWLLPRGINWNAPDERRRAARLSVEIEGERVMLEGPVEVAVGSTEVHLGLLPSWLPRAGRERLKRLIGPAGGRLPAFAPVYRSLDDGDLVHVAGVWALREAEAGEGYRGAGARLVIAPPSEVQGPPVIRLASFDEPRVFGPHPAVTLSASALGGLVGAVVFLLLRALL